MSKYIKIDDLQAFCDNQTDHSITPNDFQRMNYIEIVRCKNCEYRKQQEGQEPWLSCMKFKMTTTPYWFCADGVNKNE